MLAFNLYIHGTGSISPAADAPLTEAKRLASEPDYTAWIPPMQLRRTSKVVRMGIGAAKRCAEVAGIEKPDAISIGTAMGCLQDTEVFLGKMVNQDEKMLTPTSFIQSTHNTVGGQIALLMGCHGHNMTFVHRGHSFEHAVINTKLYLQDHPGKTVLTGGIDELTGSSHLLMQRVGFYSAGPEKANSVIAGEGAAFFTINETERGALLKIISLHLFTPPDVEEAVHEITQFLSFQQLNPHDIDWVVTGNNGASDHDLFYASIQKLFPEAESFNFKQVCGEYATASAFALSKITEAFNNGNRQDTFLPADIGTNAKQILLINHYCGHYSCWLLKS
jgi:3-oxoacyl-(acyl-carrier-protein) synthase